MLTLKELLLSEIKKDVTRQFLGSTKDCTGCLSKVHIDIGKIERDECSHTDPSTLDIPNCPCKTCIVKAMCNTLCVDLVNAARDYPRARAWPLRIGQIKSRAENVKIE